MKHLKHTYSADILEPFINWFYDTYKNKMRKEGWLISYASGLEIPKNIETQYWNKIGDFWQVQKDDNADILEDDIEAEKLARTTGLLFDNYGIVIGYNGISFLEHPEEIDYYKDMKKYNL